MRFLATAPKIDHLHKSVHSASEQINDYINDYFVDVSFLDDKWRKRNTVAAVADPAVMAPAIRAADKAAETANRVLDVVVAAAAVVVAVHRPTGKPMAPEIEIWSRQISRVMLPWRKAMESWSCIPTDMGFCAAKTITTLVSEAIRLFPER
jgi:hypothetical protein